ncbi:hypothetical protein [Pontibacter sp. HJ8]
MKNLVSERFAITGLTTIVSLSVLLHVAILMGIIPYEMVWGGRLQSHDQMVIFETISIVINLTILVIISLKAGLIQVKLHPTILRVAFGLLCGLFLLNTVGNLLSNNTLEQLLFTPLTAILAILCLRLAISKKIPHHSDPDHVGKSAKA